MICERKGDLLLILSRYLGFDGFYAHGGLQQKKTPFKVLSSKFIKSISCWKSGLVLAQRGCHHDNIVVAPRLAADIPALFQILPTSLLLLANTNSCSWSHSTSKDISSKIWLNNQQQQVTDNSFTATLTTACDTSLTKKQFFKVIHICLPLL